MTRPSTPTLAVAAAIATILLAACSEDPDPVSAPTEESPPSSPAGELIQATRLDDVAGSDAPLTPGLYALGVSSDRTDAPMVVIDVPEGYLGGGDGFEIGADEGGFRHDSTWTVADGAETPCGSTEWVDPGPGVDDLVDALAALPVWESTAPASLTIGGHDAVSMELNVPADVPADCQEGQPHSWRDHQGGTQGIGPGKTQRLWIVDVDGQRVMLVVGYFPGDEGPSPSTVEEMTAMVEGARFVSPDQLAP